MRLHQENQEGEYAHLPEEDGSLAATLYRSYAPKLFAYVCRHIPSIDDAEDVLLEVFLAVLHASDGKLLQTFTLGKAMNPPIFDYVLMTVIS